MMQRMLALSFTYQQKEYSALVRLIATFPESIIRVTIMNGELEQQFFPYNTYRLNGSDISAVNPAVDKHLATLQQIIAREIKVHWKFGQTQPAYGALANN